MTTINVTIRGETMSLADAGRRYGIKKSTLRERYWRGDRGEQLIRPLQKPGPVKAGKQREQRKVTKLADLDDMLNVKRERERLARERKQRLQRRRADALEQMRRLHAQAFSRPLISRDILTPAERQKERDRVNYSGQRRWCITGAAS